VCFISVETVPKLAKTTKFSQENLRDVLSFNSFEMHPIEKRGGEQFAMVSRMIELY
jgi:hypothetical protein